MRPAVWFWLAMLALLTGVRLVVAGATPLSPDEAYYWTWSRALAPGYLDHPPMTALWIRFGTLLCGGTALGVRLAAPLAAAVGTMLLASACADLLRTRQGCPGRPLVAALLLNATLMLGVGAVTITPDTPLLFFWTAALAALGRLLATGRAAWWLAVGGALGFALDSKYTAFLVGAGLALWLLATPVGRRWLRTPWPWAGGMVALLLFTPVVWWNAAHGWVSFAKQGGRTGNWHPARAAQFLSGLLGGQAGLATPLIFVLFVCGIARLSRDPVAGPAGETLLVWTTLPAALVFIEHAFGARVQANWPSLLYPAAAIAAASLRAGWWKPAAALGFAVTALVYTQSTAAPLALPRRLDVTLARLAGWRSLANTVAARVATDGGADRFIMADDYGLAAELAFALPHQPILAAGGRWRLFTMPHPDLDGSTGLLLRSDRRQGGPSSALFSEATPLDWLRRGRGHEIAETYRLYRVTVRRNLAYGARAEFVRLPSPTR